MKKISLILLAVLLVSLFISCKQIIDPAQEQPSIHMIWKGELESAPENPEAGFFYYNTVEKKTYMYDGTSWQVIASDGKDGANGKDGTDGSVKNVLNLIWKGELAAAPDNPEAGWFYYNTAEKKTYMFDGTSWQIIARDGSDGSDGEDGKDGTNHSPLDTTNVFLGETTEVIDSITYTVKAYADVNQNEPYFYIYTKYYYLDSKLRRTYRYDHTTNVDLDYKYSEFVEHFCGDNSKIITTTEYYESGETSLLKTEYMSGGKKYKNVTTYYDNGNKKLYSTYQNDILSSSTEYYETGNTMYQYSYNTEGKETSKYYYTYYDSGNRKQYVYYNNGILSSSYEYYESGVQKEYYSYKTDVTPSYLQTKQTYYENNKVEYQITYDSYGNESSKQYFTYHANGNKKHNDSYTNGILSVSYEYYESGVQKEYCYFKTDVYPSYMHIKYTYYDTAKQEYVFNYDSYGNEISKQYYTYYADGNKKSYDVYRNGKIDDSYTYYDSSSAAEKKRIDYDYTNEGLIIGILYKYLNGNKKLYIDYKTDGTTLEYFQYCYESGYTQFYFISGFLYTCNDGKTTGIPTTSSEYSSKEAYTPEQAVSKANELTAACE